MDMNARAAFVVAQAACMNAELEAMKAENLIRPNAFSPSDFRALPDQFLVGHNAVIEYLRD